MKKIRTHTYRLLRGSQKYTKTDMVYFSKGSSWLMSGHGVVIISGIALAAAFANLVPKEVYGNYKFILSLGGVLGALTLTGMKTAVTQSVARGFDGELRAGFLTQLKWSAFVALAAFSGAIYYFVNENNTIAVSLIILGLTLPLINSGDLYRSFLNGKKDFKRETIYSTLQNVTPLIILFGAIFFTQNIILLILITLTSQLCMSLLMYVRTLHIYKPKDTLGHRTTYFAKHLSFMNVISAVATHIDKILIFHFLGAAQLAIYAFAILIPLQLNTLLKKIEQLSFPKFSEKTRSEVKKNLLQKTVKLTGLTIIIAGIYVLIAPYFFNLVFPQYTESIFYSKVFALNIILTGATLFVGVFIKSHKLIRENQITIIFHHSIRIILMLLLIVPFGVLVVILSILIARAAGIILSFIIMYRLKTD